MTKSTALVTGVMLAVCSLASGYINFEYFEGTWDNIPDFDALTAVDTGVVSNFDLSERLREENFGFRFRAILTVETEGLYTFFVESDDGSSLYIDGAIVANNDGTHGMEERSGSKELAVGEHVIEVRFFQKSGGLGLGVYYSGPGIDKQIVPDGLMRVVEVPATHQASYPFPPDGAKAVDPAVVLSWEKPGLVNGAQYDVYISTDPNFVAGPEVLGIQDLMYDPLGAGELVLGTEYYWRIDVYDPNQGGLPDTHTGELWSFTTRSGLLALYEFETGPADSTPNGHDGAYMGVTDPNIVTDQSKGNVLRLNQDGQGDGQYVEVGSLGISGNAPRTIAGWARADGGVIPEWTGIFGFSPAAGGNGNYFDVQRGNSGNYVLHVHGWQEPFCTVDDKWHHFAATYDGRTIAWYLDGKPMGLTARVLDTVDEFRIGARLSHSNYFPGFVNDVAVWDYALAPHEIEDLFLWADFDKDDDVDGYDLNVIAQNWLADSVIPGSIMDPAVLDDFEIYPTVPLSSFFGWFRMPTNDPFVPHSFELLTGVEGPYGGNKAMLLSYDFEADSSTTVWLVTGHRFLDNHPIWPYRDAAKYDELRFRIRYHEDNTEDVGLFVHFGNDPDRSLDTEHEAVQIGPLSTLDDVADPNQWHEIVIDLHSEDSLVRWGPDGSYPYSSIDEIHHMNGILVSIVNDGDEARSGRISLDDFRLVDYTPDCDGLPLGDLNSDCYVDLRDFVILAGEWLREL